MFLHMLLKQTNDQQPIEARHVLVNPDQVRYWQQTPGGNARAVFAPDQSIILEESFNDVLMMTTDQAPLVAVDMRAEISPERAVELIADHLNRESDWNADTLQEVADILRLAGREVGA